MNFEFYKNNFGDLEDGKNQIPMKTTVNPDGSISSEGSGTLIGGELVEPGKPLTEKQKLTGANLQKPGSREKKILEYRIARKMRHLSKKGR